MKMKKPISSAATAPIAPSRAIPKLRRNEKKAAKCNSALRIGRQRNRGRYPARIAAFMVNGRLILNNQCTNTISNSAYC
jgi:hypothetical protein